MLAMTFGLKRNEDRERKTHRERGKREKCSGMAPTTMTTTQKVLKT